MFLCFTKVFLDLIVETSFNYSFYFAGGVPIRAVIWVMLFTCTCFLYMLRVNLSIILLAMVESSTSQSNSTNGMDCTPSTTVVSNTSISHTGLEIPDVSIYIIYSEFKSNSEFMGELRNISILTLDFSEIPHPDVSKYSELV